MAVATLCVVMAAAAVQAVGPAQAQVCTACHGPDGNSSSPIWPNLAAQNPSYLVAQLKAFKSGARENPAMSPMLTALEDKDFDDIANFFAAQSLRVAPVVAADVAAGQKLYRGGDAERGIPACQACHGPDGAGNPGTGYPALQGQHPEYVVLQLQNYRDGKRKTDPQQMMRMLAKRLTDDDMKQLARYVSALH